MASKLYALGRWCAHHSRRVIAAWVLVVVAIGVLGVTDSGKLSSTFSIPGTESQNAADLLASQFPVVNGGTARVVLAGAVTEPKAEAAVAAGIAAATKVPGVVSVANPYTAGALSASKTVAYLDVTFSQKPVDVPSSSVDAVKAAFTSTTGAAGLQTEFTGTTITGSSSSSGEAIGVLAAYVILGITLVGLVVAGLPLLIALIGVAVSLLGVQFVASFVDLTTTVTALASMIGLAVGIDYTLFLVSRHRDQLRDKDVDVHESIGRTMGTSGSAVTFAATTVVIALAALAVAGIPFLTVMGIGAAATVVVDLLLALTLVPAIMGALGDRMRPKRPRAFSRRRRTDAAAEAPRVQGQWGLAWGRTVTRAPALTIAICLVGSLVLAYPATHLRLGLPGNEVQPASSTQHKAYDLLTEGFGPGFNATLTAVVDVRGIPAAERTQVLTALQTKLSADPDLARVGSPVLNQTQTVGILALIPKTGPDDDATTTLVHRVRDTDKQAVTEAGGVMYVAGATAANLDISHKIGSALPRFVVVIVLLAMALLTLAFRSLLVPVKAVLGFLLSVAASVGITVFVFQDGHLASLFGVPASAPILSFLPILLIGILFGLAMDYEVFLVSRIREEYDKLGDPKQAVLAGMANSGRVVTAAALIMTFVFAGFVTAPDPIVKSIGLALAAGVLVDAFVVRLTLVPAVLFLLGRRAWSLPGWLDRHLPNVDIEGSTLPALQHGRLSKTVVFPGDSDRRTGTSTGARGR